MATPTTTTHVAGPGNVYIPSSGYTRSPGATRQMHIEFSRNPSTFAFNQYAQVVPDAAPKGLYAVLDTDEAVRVVNLQDFEWPDGDDAPQDEGRRLTWKKFATNRRAFPFRVGHKTRENAEFDIIGANSRMVATKAMTARSYDAIGVMTTSSNWGDNYSATVDALLSTTGASWISSSATELFIQRSFHTVVSNIIKGTCGAIRLESHDIGVVISPDVAFQMARTAEVRAYVVNNEQALPYWESTGVYAAYNLPPIMYGVRIIVEDAVRVSTRHGAASTTRGYMTGNNAIFVSRPNGLTGGVEGAPTFSTVTAFVHEDMTVETKDDPDNRRVVGRVVDDIDVVITAPISGWLVGDITT